jgi:hypothetical protein
LGRTSQDAGSGTLESVKRQETNGHKEAQRTQIGVAKKDILGPGFFTCAICAFCG